MSFPRGILGNSLKELPVRRDLFRRQVAQRLKKEIEATLALWLHISPFYDVSEVKIGGLNATVWVEPRMIEFGKC